MFTDRYFQSIKKKKNRQAVLRFFFLVLCIDWGSRLQIMAEEEAGAAVDYLRGLPIEIRSRLSTEGEVVNYIENEQQPLFLLPQVALAENIRTTISERSYNCGVEVLQKIGAVSELFPEGDALISIYNIMNKVSTLSGLRYFSASRGYETTLFDSVHFVRSHHNPSRLPDPTYYAPYPYRRAYISFSDSSFGEYINLAAYRSNDYSILLAMSNLDPVWYNGMFFAAAENQLKLNAMAFVSNETLYFYGLVVLDFRGLASILVSPQPSLYNRIKAISGWFDRQLR